MLHESASAKYSGAQGFIKDLCTDKFVIRSCKPEIFSALGINPNAPVNVMSYNKH